MKTIALSVILYGCINLLYGQQWKPISKAEALDILSKMNEWYKEHPDYSVNVGTTSYIGFSNTTPHEVFNGYAIVHGSYYHSNIVGIETMQNDQYKIIVDTADKSMIVSYPEKETSMIRNLPDSASIYMISSCYLMKQGNLLSLRLDYKKGLKIERNEIILENDYRIDEIVFYFHQGSHYENVEESDNEKPKVVVKYSDYKLKNAAAGKDFSTQNYVLQGDSNKLIPALPYTDFELLDSRIK